MLFLLQKEKSEYRLEELMLKQIIEREKYTHEYLSYSLQDFYNIVYNKEIKELKKEQMKKENYSKTIQESIPIGTIEFVTTWLNIFKEIKQMNPIEVPLCLRTKEFLKRSYSILPYGELPREGNYFIKDVTKLKNFSYTGDMNYFFTKCNSNDSILDNSHLYQVSEIVKVLSEYRVYIIDGSIQAVENYDGDPCIFPDVSLIQKANLLYSLQKDYPKSYTIDVMVTDRGTCLCEFHIFFATGLYSTIFGNSLLYAYRDALDYTVFHNTPQIIDRGE